MLKKLLKEKVRAVHDEDLDEIFEGLGILNKFKRGDLKCVFCGDPISHKNLHSLFPLSGDIKFVCEKVTCIAELFKLIREGKVTP